jgi:hypothetical protein
MSRSSTPRSTIRQEPARPVNLKDGDLANPVPLNDFMSELGTIMRLPKKEGPVAAPVAVAAAPARHGWSARTMVLPAIAVLLAAGVAWGRVAGTPALTDLPRELQGEWKTSHPKYRDRQLSFTADRVGLALQEGRAPQLYPISALTMRTRADTTVLSITYVEEGAPVDFRVSLVRGARPMLWLSNPPDVVWVPVRESAAGAAANAAESAARRATAGVPLPPPVTTGPKSGTGGTLPALPAEKNWRK